MIPLHHQAVGFFVCEVDHEIREIGGQNRGPRVEKYLRNCDPPISTAAPWCAAVMQYGVDIVADMGDFYNPLDQVRLEAYVQSYHDWGVANGLIVPAGVPGDLVLYSFGGQRFDHIGMVYKGVRRIGDFLALEGNTSPGIGLTPEERDREGDGFYIKNRAMGKGYKVAFLRWWSHP